VRRWFLFALAVFTAAHAFIWWQLVSPLPSPWWQLGTAVIVGIAPSFPLIRRFGRRLERDAARPWMLLGYLWFGLVTYMLLAAVVTLVAVVFGADARLAAIVGLASAVAVVVGGILQVIARGPVVRRVRVPLAKLGVPSYTIVQLTDVHIGPLIGRGFAERIVRRVNAVDADMIVITGDLIDGPLHELAKHVEPLRGLHARDGVYAVTGNHESYWDPVAWIDHIRSLGIRVLRNEHVTVGEAFQLAGVDDWTVGEDVPRAVAGRDPQLPLVLLAHHPRTIERALAAGVDLQLSGHTHGGQMLPLGWLARIWDPVVAGLARFGNSWLYVSEGTGFWGPPVRVGTCCEVAAITLVR
jgi:uncharacterized protein